jgi:hypothetical protein
MVPRRGQGLETGEKTLFRELGLMSLTATRAVTSVAPESNAIIAQLTPLFGKCQPRVRAYLLGKRLPARNQ